MHAQRTFTIVIGLAAGFLMAPNSWAIKFYHVDNLCQGAGDGSQQNPYCSINTAIQAARLDTGETDRRILVKGHADVAYTGTSNRNLFLDQRDNNTTIQCDGSPCIIDCENAAARGFSIQGGSRVKIKGLTIRRCGGVNDGAGMHIHDSSPTIADNVIENCTANINGGAIYVAGDSGDVPIITGNTIRYNTADEGGGIYINETAAPKIAGNYIHNNAATVFHAHGGGIAVNSGNVEITGCIIEANTANLGEAGGGGIAVMVDLVKPIDRCTIIDNHAAFNGGGVFVIQSGTLTITRSIISGNSSNAYGGGIGGKSLADLKIISCRVTENTTNTEGAGIYALDDVYIYNSVVAKNTVTNQSGGGIWAANGVPVIVSNSTIADNVSINGQGGGIGGSADVLVRNSIFWGNTDANGQAEQIKADNLDAAWSNIEEGLLGVDIDEQTTWGNGMLDGDPNSNPNFVNPSIGDYRTAAGSEGNDSANNDDIPVDVADLNGNGNTTEKTPYDLDEQVRRVDDPVSAATGFPAADSPWVDMGAHELCREMKTPLVPTEWLPASRFLALQLLAPDKSPSRAIRVRLTSLLEGAENFTDLQDQVMWVGPVNTCPDQGAPFDTSYKCAKLQCTPRYASDWPTTEVIYVYGPEVVPASIYDVEIVDVLCQGNEGTCTDVSCALQAKTAVFGDVVPPISTSKFAGSANVVDISAIVDKLKDLAPGLIEPRAFQKKTDPAIDAINVIDLHWVVEAVRGFDYPFDPPAACP